jgi:hypothetical protein
MLPREHGAWGIVLLPFLAGALVAGSGPSKRVILGAAAALSCFLLREPLLFLRPTPDCGRQVTLYRILRPPATLCTMETSRRARTSLTVYSAVCDVRNFPFVALSAANSFVCFGSRSRNALST